MLNVEGRFKARIVNHATEETKTGAVQFLYQVHAFAQWRDNEWNLIGEEEITGRELLAYKDKQTKADVISDIGVERLQKAIGWNCDFDALNNGAYVGVTVQITTGLGKPYTDADGNAKDGKFQVLYLNEEDFEGFQIRPMDAAKVNSLKTRFGAKLRAQFGGAIKKASELKPPVKVAPTMTASEVAADLSIPADAIPPDEPPLPDLDGPPPEPPKPATKQEAWDAVFKRCENDRALATTEWNALLKKYGQDWDKIIAHDGIPF